MSQASVKPILLNETASMSEAKPTPWLKQVILPGLLAVRRLWKPFVLIQLCGLAFVVSYFKIDAVRSACDQIAQVKAHGGYAFSAVVMAICSGVCPEVFKFITGVDRSLTRRRGRDILFGMALFALCGVCVDAFYRGLAVVFGHTREPLAVVAKVLSDQLVYSPTLGTGLIATGYALRRERYDVPALLRKMSGRWYLQTIAPLLPPCWAYWFPMTTLMYSLPTSLTFVYGACASAASATLLVAVASRHDIPEPPEPLIAAAAP
ncbi:MAG: hypothetical protein ACTHLN_01435 [Tepidisphaeraceae bacterium]